MSKTGRAKETLKRTFVTDGKVVDLETIDKITSMAHDGGIWCAFVYGLLDDNRIRICICMFVTG